CAWSRQFSNLLVHLCPDRTTWPVATRDRRFTGRAGSIANGAPRGHGPHGQGQPRSRAGPTSARMTPRIALASRDDQPPFVRIVRSVFLVTRVREGGWK